MEPAGAFITVVFGLASAAWAHAAMKANRAAVMKRERKVMMRVLQWQFLPGARLLQAKKKARSPEYKTE
jgi:hypothetical protein